MKNNAAPPALHIPEALSQLLTREFIFVTGKGGVGKSTCATLLALEAARRGNGRTLLVLPSSETNSSVMLGRALTEVPTEVAPGVDAVIIRPESAMRQYLGGILKSPGLASLLFHSRVARGLLMGIPGPSEWAILGKTWSWSRSGTFDLPLGERRYDLVILDAPASGDGSDMLRLPQVIVELAPAARLRADAASCLSSLRDPQKTAIVLVTLPEAVVIQETEENIEVVRNDLGLALGPLLVNQVRRPVFDREDRILLKNAPDPTQEFLQMAKFDSNQPPSAEARRLRCFEVARNLAQREVLELEHLTRLRRLGLPTLEIPYVQGGLGEPSSLQKLQMALAQGH